MTVTIFLLILWGGIVRNTGAGLACPDWPLCHGRIIPPLEGPILIEYSHRLLAATVGIWILGCAIGIWSRPRLRPHLGKWALLAVLALAVQVVLGGLAVKGLLHPPLVAAHLALALGLFALILEMTLRAYRLSHGGERDRPQRSRLWAASWGTTALVYLQAALGGVVSSYQAGFACPDFPTCNGLWLPPFEGPVGLHMAHRIGAATVAVAVTGLVIGGSSVPLMGRPRLLLRAVLLLFVFQVLLGIGNVLFELPPWINVPHLGTAVALLAMLWGTTHALAYGHQAFAAPQTSPAGEENRPAEPPSALATPALRGRPWLPLRPAPYLSLTKPRVVLLFSLTGVTAMVLEGFARRSPGQMGLALLGITLTAASANALNQYLERDLDARMARTCQRRPLPRGLLAPLPALLFGIVLGIVAVALLAWAYNLLSALLALGTILFYAIVYTLWLKPRTPYNIVIGGLAGATAPLIGWAAATGHLAPLPFILFLIIFFWTPPHFWALALWVKEDYQAVRIPMFPLVFGEDRTRTQILRYLFILLPLTLLLVVGGYCGWLYGLLAILLGVGFIQRAWTTWQTGSREAAHHLFGYSILYLLALFVGMMIDAWLKI